MLDDFIRCFDSGQRTSLILVCFRRFRIFNSPTLANTKKDNHLRIQSDRQIELANYLIVTHAYTHQLHIVTEISIYIYLQLITDSYKWGYEVPLSQVSRHP